MFARAVSIKVKHDGESELARFFEQEVVPRFQQEPDFLGLLAFILTDGTEALSLSLWDYDKISGGNCSSDLGPLTALPGVVRGTPSVQVYWVSPSTLHTMKNMLGQEVEVEALRDLEVYQSCATPFPMVARMVHAQLRIPASVSSYDFNAQGNPYL
ncbi:MAG TPA: hypothetical protein VG028_04920 [Terriglobia bacterium]|nr:hypothetical protein [Terriglobia bacterium]